MKASSLKNPFYHYGNKGAVWSNETHIAESGSFSGETLCGTPMLASNWARIENHETIGCPSCLTAYLESKGYILTCDIKDVKFDEYNRPYYTNDGKIMLSKTSYEYQVAN
jgi:hypothetical protein